MAREESPLWFGKKEGGFPVTPLTWQGRMATALYVVLVLVAVITYSQLTLTAFVIGFYTVAFVCLVAYKSDLLENWPPGS
jgi:multisubunit Na+/H+ antiporter MnhC subunit